MTDLDDQTLATRVALLEATVQRLTAPTPTPQAAPITIGPFTNVPAPGSPIRSDWPQSVSQWINDRQVATATVALTLALATADTTGLWITGSYTFPVKPFKRIAWVHGTVNLTATGEADLHLRGAGDVLYRRARTPAASGQGRTLRVATALTINANAAESVAFKLAAVAGTVQVALIGPADLNYLEVITFPTWP